MRRNFNDFIEGYLDYTKNHESTTRIQKWSIISVIAAALERKVWINRGYYTLYPNLYVFIIARSGLVKKSTSTAIAVDLLREVNGIHFMTERMTAASLIQQLAESVSDFQLNGVEIKQRPLFAYSSELAVMMTEVYGSIIELLTTFYDCVPHDSSKPWVNKAKHENVIKIYGPCLNILGASTMEWLKRCIPDSDMNGGFASRAIFVVENNPPDRLVAWPEVDKEMAKNKKKLIEDLITINELKGEFKIDSEVKKMFTNWYNFNMKEVIPNCKDSRFMGYLSRKGDMMLKLAMIKSVSSGNSLIIKKEDFEWAGSELEDLEQDMMNAFRSNKDNGKRANKDFDELARNEALVLTAIHEGGNLKQEDIEKKLPGIKPKDISRAIFSLMENNQINYNIDSGVEIYSIQSR